MRATGWLLAGLLLSSIVLTTLTAAFPGSVPNVLWLLPPLFMLILGLRLLLNAGGQADRVNIWQEQLAKAVHPSVARRPIPARILGLILTSMGAFVLVLVLTDSF